MSNSLWSHGLQPARLLCPWGFPGKNAGVGCRFLLQGTFLTQGSNLYLLHCRQQILYPWATRDAHGGQTLLWMWASSSTLDALCPNLAKEAAEFASNSDVEATALRCCVPGSKVFFFLWLHVLWRWYKDWLRTILCKQQRGVVFSDISLWFIFTKFPEGETLPCPQWGS